MRSTDRYIEESTMRSIIYLVHFDLSELLSVLTESQSNHDNHRQNKSKCYQS
nr:MAG TPA: hypothetical protein [Caudoviricetes sp.]